MLSTVAWSSEFDSRRVVAGGRLVNLATGAMLWLGLRSAANARAWTRFFPLMSCAFLPSVSASVLVGVSGLLNPIGIQLVWQSALP